MIIGGIKHREQRFNSRSAGVSSALLFISIGGTYCMAAAHVTHFSAMARGVMLFWVARLSVRSTIFQERHLRIPSNLAQRGNDWI